MPPRRGSPRAALPPRGSPAPGASLGHGRARTRPYGGSDSGPSAVGDRLVAARLGGPEHRVADLRGAVTVLEGRSVWPDVGVARDRIEHVMDLVHERVLPPDHVAVRPPPAPEGVVCFRDEDRAEAL